MNYRVQFTNALADVEITSLHERLHEIFQQILDETIGSIPPQDHVCFVLHCNQLEYPINFPFTAPGRLATERILAEFKRVIQSNKEFRLNDTVEINVIYVSMPTGGKGTKRSEVNLEKHLEKKKSIIRIRNEDELCMARALVVAKANLDNDPQYKCIVDRRGTMQTRMAQELHQNAGVPLGPCGIEQAKQFQAYLSEYQISIVSKEYGNKVIYAGPEKDCTCITTIMTSSPKCLDFSPVTTIVTRVRRLTSIRRSIGARMRASVVNLRPSALRCPG